MSEELQDLISQIRDELKNEYDMTDDSRGRKNNRDKTLHQGMISAYENVLDMIVEITGEEEDGF